LVSKDDFCDFLTGFCRKFFTIYKNRAMIVTEVLFLGIELIKNSYKRCDFVI